VILILVHVAEGKQKILSIQIIFLFILVEIVEKNTATNVVMEMELLVQIVVQQAIRITTKYILELLV
jgi:hypothetical protein